ncbi:MAG: hypothetical protein MJ141_07475, partial [Clostridia bacterium]|nr:hypothetical protein [Clostridia bacterium]
MRIPMKPDPRNTSVWRHAQKKVLASLPLSDASDLSKWAIRSHQEVIKGAAMDSRGIDAGVLTAAVRDGKTVARMTCPVDCTEKNKDYGRGWGLCTLVYDTGSANFRDYNRIAFECYPDLPGFRVVTLCIYLYNEGEIAEPNDMSREGLHFVCLENHKRNTVYWEIPELARDKVYGIGLQYRMQGAEPGAAREISYDFTNLRMEKVDADTAKGWLPKDHEIIFSHAGYMPDMAKTAIARGVKSADFQIIRADDGLVCYAGTVKTPTRYTGAYPRFDLSHSTEEGRFFLKAGADITRTFSISRKVWKSSVEKTFNFFFAERCGYLVPGIHDICHADFQCRHGDVTKVINGG